LNTELDHNANIWTSPPSTSGSTEESSKNEGFLKSVWHKLTEKNSDASKTEPKGAKDATDAKEGDKKESGKDDSKKSS
jgi:molecular chaperone DnaJ